MFSMLLDFINTPGETSEIAREAVLFALRLVDNDPEFLCYIVEYSGFAETLVFTLILFIDIDHIICSHLLIYQYKGRSISNDIFSNLRGHFNVLMGTEL